MSSPEDHPSWGKKPSEDDSPTIEACVRCKNTMVVWHCSDAGCPWCKQCATKLTKEANKNGKGPV